MKQTLKKKVENANQASIKKSSNLLHLDELAKVLGGANYENSDQNAPMQGLGTIGGVGCWC